jgi:hypothetical protein
MVNYVYNITFYVYVHHIQSLTLSPPPPPSTSANSPPLTGSALLFSDFVEEKNIKDNLR